MLMLTAIIARAARAYSEPFTVGQPDGTQLTLILHGDEHLSWLTTTDGIIVVETQQGYCVATIDDNGHLTTTPCWRTNLPSAALKNNRHARASSSVSASFFSR